MGADESPIEFDYDELNEICEGPEIVMTRWHTPDAYALFWSLSGLPSYRPHADDV